MKEKHELQQYGTVTEFDTGQIRLVGDFSEDQIQRAMERHPYEVIGVAEGREEKSETILETSLP